MTCVPSSIDSNVHGPRSSGADDGKGGRAHEPLEELERRHALLGQEHARDRVFTVGGAKERQTLGVIPVQVAEQDRAAKRIAAHQRRHGAQACAGVEHEPRRGFVVVGQGDARRVATDAGELGTDRGCRTAHPAEVDTH